MGNVLDKVGRSEEAIEYYKEVTKIDPKHALAYYNIGWALDRLGKCHEAV